jgi:hypothetical protein
MPEELIDNTVETTDVEIKDDDVTEDGLPLYVRLNPKHGAMWMDDISGLYVAEEGTTDRDGRPVKEYARVPIKADCSRIRKALQMGILVPCDPSGRSKKIRESFIVKADTIEKLMKMKQNTLIPIIDQVRDADFLSKMKQWEDARKDKDRRLAVLQAIASRLKSRDVIGITQVESTPSMVYDNKSGRMVKDVIKVR